MSSTPASRLTPRALVLTIALVVTSASIGIVTSIAAVGGGPVSDGVPRELLTPLTLSTLSEPEPVRGTDGNRHLDYELMMTNPTVFDVTVERVRAIDPATGDALADLDADAVATHTVVVGGTGITGTIPAGSTGFLVIDVLLAPGDIVPERLVHRLAVTIEGDAPTLATAFAGARIAVDRRRAVKLVPPLRGDRWLVGNGCCDAMNSHRAAVLPVNAAFHVAERFAIDFVRLDADGMLFDGPIDELESYPFYGAPIRAAGDGVVVATQDGLPDQEPGALPEDLPIDEAGGNFVVVAIGQGRFAFYAHMIPGSLRVEVGDQVRAGRTVLGRLGNSGNTDAPHLHFHVMDGVGPLSSNGLPYTFDAFEVEGTVTNLGEVAAGQPADVDASGITGAFRHRLPLDLQLVDFPS